MAVFRRQFSDGSIQKAVFRRQFSDGSIQKAVFRRQYSEGSIQKAEDRLFRTKKFVKICAICGKKNEVYKVVFSKQWLEGRSCLVLKTLSYAFVPFAEKNKLVNLLNPYAYEVKNRCSLTDVR